MIEREREKSLFFYVNILEEFSILENVCQRRKREDWIFFFEKIFFLSSVNRRPRNYNRITIESFLLMKVNVKNTVDSCENTHTHNRIQVDLRAK